MLTPTGHPDHAYDEPYSLYIEYEHLHHNHVLEGPPCPKIELHFVVEPAHFHVDSIECTAEELEVAHTHELPEHIILGHDTHVEEHTLVMPSTWIKEEGQHPESLFTVSEEWDDLVATIDVDITVERGGIFSAIAATDFSNLFVYMTLYDHENLLQPLAEERSFILDDVEMEEDHWAKDGDMNVAGHH